MRSTEAVRCMRGAWASALTPHPHDAHMSLGNRSWTVVEPLTSHMRDIEFRVLGPLEVLVEGHALELKRRKQRSLLALLLLNTGEIVSTDKLIEELWAGEPPKA